MKAPRDIRIHVYFEKEVTLEFEGISIHINRFSKIEEDNTWSIASHAHMNYELHYIFDGKGTIGLGQNSFDIKKNEFYVCSPFIDHSQLADSETPMKEYCIECSIEVKGQERASKDTLSFIQIIRSIPNMKFMDQSMTLNPLFECLEKNCINRCTTNAPEILDRSLLLSIILTIMFATSRVENRESISRIFLENNYVRASSIRNYLEANYKSNIRITDCSEVFYLSTRQINRILKAEFDATFNSLLLEIRFNVAKKLLMTTNMSIEDIAIEAGFSGYRQMLRCFNKNGIMFPSKLREEIEQS